MNGTWAASSGEHQSGHADRLRLGDREAHLWYACVDRWCAPWMLDGFQSLLSAEERRRLRRLATDRLRREYLVTRALCRLTLSRYADVHPADWTFRTSSHGRPQIDWPGTAVRLDFNLSNTRGLVACIVTAGTAAGVDVEALERRCDDMAIAEGFFSSSEVTGLRALPRAEQRRRFLELWTLKEAYVKARGLGLEIPLEKLAFDIGPRGIAVSLDVELCDDPRDWQFALHEIEASHLIAVGIRKGRSADFSIDVSEAILLDEGSWTAVA